MHHNTKITFYFLDGFAKYFFALQENILFYSSPLLLNLFYQLQKVKEWNDCLLYDGDAFAMTIALQICVHSR